MGKGWLDGTLYRALVDADLEGIIAKRLSDACHPKLARWHKVFQRATRSAAAASPMFFASTGGSMLGGDETT
jgi:hypothetical protein